MSLYGSLAGLMNKWQKQGCGRDKRETVTTAQGWPIISDKWRSGVRHLSRDFRWINLYNDILYQNSVKNIFNCKKTEAGVAMVWHDGKEEKSEVFSFSELDEMRINVQDLIEHPDLYRIDLQEHKIYQSQVGRNAY